MYNWREYSAIPGHGTVATVVEADTNVTCFKLGDRVLAQAADLEENRNRSAEGAFQLYTIVSSASAASRGHSARSFDGGDGALFQRYAQPLASLRRPEQEQQQQHAAFSGAQRKLAGFLTLSSMPALYSCGGFKPSCAIPVLLSREWNGWGLHPDAL